MNIAVAESGSVAAFFDVDGTLTPLPSLERRFFRILRYRREIPARNYFLWLREALRLMPRGISAISQANKMYLRGVQAFYERDHGDGNLSSWHKDGHRARGQASAPPRRNPRLPVPTFFAQAIERVAWHANQGHAIVLLSGTLDPLAQQASCAIEAALAARGIVVAIHVCATRPEEKDARWTGRILGQAMYGEAKARAVKRLVGEMQLHLPHCYAYGDSANDRWLLAAVGWPAAVNASRELARIARMRGWPILRWEPEKKLITQRGKQPKAISESLPGNCNMKNSAAEIVERAE
jgi:HAD superfamily hydrolase (TIGR01490 family)